MSTTGLDLRKMRMKSASHGNKVLLSMSSLRQNDELCDFVVCAQGKTLSVHKILLAATSDYFRAMLTGPMKESKEASVDLKGLTAEALQNIVDFIYSGEMDLESESLHDVLNAASHLQVQTALDLCSEYMIKFLTFANADDLLHIADMYSLAEVANHYKDKVLHNFEEFSHTEQFLALKPAQLARYLADDGLRIKSEAMLCDIVAKWYAHDQKHVEHLESIVKHIRFGLMSEVQLSNLHQHWLTRQFPNTMNHISEGLKYHRDASMGHPWLSSSSRVRANNPTLVLVHQGSPFTHRPFEVTSYNHVDGRFYQLATDVSGSRDCRIISTENFTYICRVVDCGGGTLMNSLLRFDPRHLVLQELTPCRCLRIDPALVAKGQWLYIFGGTNENGYTILDSVECYDVRSNSWVDLHPLPQGTHSHSAVVCKDAIYLSGGVSGPERQPSSALFCYTPSAHTWETKTSMHCARRLHEVVCVEAKLFVLGGIGSHSFHQQTQIPIESYNTDTDQWTLLSSTLAGRSIGHFLVQKDKVLSLGREHYEATEDDIWEYNTQTDLWQHYTKAPRRTGLTTASGTKLHVNYFDEKVSKRVMSVDKRQ